MAAKDNDEDNKQKKVTKHIGGMDETRSETETD